jgi:hypothetical protein
VHRNDHTVTPAHTHSGAHAGQMEFSCEAVVMMVQCGETDFMGASWLICTLPLDRFPTDP